MVKKRKKHDPEVVKMADLIAKYGMTPEEEEKLLRGFRIALGLDKKKEEK